MVLRLCGLKLLFGSIVLVDSAEAGYYFILFCFVDKVVEALFKFFGAYLCGLDVGYPDAFVCILVVFDYEKQKGCLVRRQPFLFITNPDFVSGWG